MQLPPITTIIPKRTPRVAFVYAHAQPEYDVAFQLKSLNGLDMYLVDFLQFNKEDNFVVFCWFSYILNPI